jgi:hypothetical protein
MVICDQFHPREPILNHRYGIIHGVIIHHPYLCLKISNGSFDTQQCLLQEMAHIIVDNDDR